MSVTVDFDYHYFDDPEGYGYRGYVRRPYGSQVVEPWEEVAHYCRQQRVCSAIDIGCAKGFLVEALLANGINAVGYDVSEYALSFAEDLPCYKHDVRCGLPINAETVIALGVLMYLSEEEVTGVLGKIWEATDKIFLFSCHYEGTKQVIPDPLRSITKPRDWWLNTIEHAGFSFEKEAIYFDIYSK